MQIKFFTWILTYKHIEIIHKEKHNKMLIKKNTFFKKCFENLGKKTLLKAG